MKLCILSWLENHLNAHAHHIPQKSTHKEKTNRTDTPNGMSTFRHHAHCALHIQTAERVCALFAQLAYSTRGYQIGVQSKASPSLHNFIEFEFLIPFWCIVWSRVDQLSAKLHPNLDRRNCTKFNFIERRKGRVLVLHES